jgi:potassium/hydrogen antiporter
VLVSLVVQGWTIAPAARLLGLEIPPTPEPTQRLNLDIPGHLEREIATYRVMPECLAADRRLTDLRLPDESHITAVVRGDAVLTFDPELRLLPSDLVYVFTDPGHIPQLNRLFDPHRVPDRLEEHRFYGDFVLDGSARVADVAEMYGLDVAGVGDQQTLAEYLSKLFHRRPDVGDSRAFGKADLVVREISDGRISKVGLRVRR